MFIILIFVPKVQVQIHSEHIKFLIDYYISEGNGKPLREILLPVTMETMVTTSAQE